MFFRFVSETQPTFDCCPDWLREIEEYASPKVLKVLVGNKTDRDDREIPAEVGDEFAQRHGMYYLETSAKACDNVDRLFSEIAHELLQVFVQCMQECKYPGYSILDIKLKFPPLQQSKTKEVANFNSPSGHSLSSVGGNTTSINQKCCNRMS